MGSNAPSFTKLTTTLYDVLGTSCTEFYPTQMKNVAKYGQEPPEWGKTEHPKSPSSQFPAQLF
jgi:hypothetical protein